MIATLLLALAQDAVPAQPLKLANPSNAHEPQLAIDDAGTVALVCGTSSKVYAWVSTDRGQSFKDPVLVGDAGVLAVGMRRGPKISVSGQSLCVAAIGGAKGGGKDGDVLTWISKDRGQTWQGPARVNTVAGSAREGLHALAIGPQGQLFCCWIDIGKDAPEVLGALSTDGGATWSASRKISGPTGAKLCPCCSPSLAFESDGTLHATWRADQDGMRDIVMASSKDAFATPANSAQHAGSSAWKIEMCPMDGGTVCAAGDDACVAWRSGAKVLLASTRLLSQEHEVGAGQQPWMAIGLRAHVVWSERRGGKLLERSFGREFEASTPREIAPSATWVVLAAPPTRGKGPLIAAWETSYDKDSELRVLRLED